MAQQAILPIAIIISGCSLLSKIKFFISGSLSPWFSLLMRVINSMESCKIGFFESTANILPDSSIKGLLSRWDKELKWKDKRYKVPSSKQSTLYERENTTIF